MANIGNSRLVFGKTILAAMYINRYIYNLTDDEFLMTSSLWNVPFGKSFALVVIILSSALTFAYIDENVVALVTVYMHQWCLFVHSIAIDYLFFIIVPAAAVVSHASNNFNVSIMHYRPFTHVYMLCKVCVCSTPLGTW